MAIEINEIRLTAYALGELYGAERAAVEAHLADDREAQRFVNEMRDTARLVTNELAHEPVVGLLAVHHAAIEQRLEEAERLRQPLRMHHAPLQPLRARLRHWAALSLSAAAAVLIVGGAVWVVAPQLYGPDLGHNTPVAKNTTPAPYDLPGYRASTDSSPQTQVAQNANGTKTATPDPFTRPDAVAVDDHHPQPATTTLAPNSQDATVRDAVADGSTNNAGTLPFGPPPTDVAPRGGKRLRSDEDVAMTAAPARGGADQGSDLAPSRLARSDDNRGVENYASILENRFVYVNESPLSSFDVNVEPASYLAARRAINAGQRVSPANVRIEEFLNAFAYDYKQPEGDAAFRASIEVADCPWDNQHRLVRVGLRAKDAPADKRPQAGNLVFLVDVSGSMAQDNRLPLLKEAMRSLVKTMTPADRLSIVTYGGASGEGTLTLAPASGRDQQKVQDAIGGLSASGAPARGDAAIDLAYKTVSQTQPLVRGVHRVVLCTGDALALNDQLRVLRLAEDKAKANVGLSVIGLGAARLNDLSMRSLARRANGTYAYADTLAEATRAVNAAAAPAVPVVAKNVRVQVEFNPLVAGGYRLIGYENGPVSTEDVVGGDQVSAGSAVTALYEVVPAGKLVPGGEAYALKYSKRNGFQAPAEGKSDELLTLKVSYVAADDAAKSARPEERRGKPLEFAVKDSGGKYDAASPDFKFAAAVAEFALVLRGSEHRGQADLERVARLAAESAGNDKAKAEFAELVRKTITQGR